MSADTAGPTQPASFSISPGQVTVDCNTASQFTVTPSETQVDWKIAPLVGTITQTGLYTSPAASAKPQQVLVVATSKDGIATATVNIEDPSGTILRLGWFAVIFGILVTLCILSAWTYLYQQQDTSTAVVVTPSLVSLDSTNENTESILFSAAVVGNAKDSVDWSVKGDGEIDASGLFLAKKPQAGAPVRDTTVTARSKAFPALTGSAVIHSADKHYEITPQPESVYPGQQILFRVPGIKVEWSVSRSDLATIAKQSGAFRAGSSIASPAPVQVIAWHAGEAVAAVSVIVSAGPAPPKSGSPVMLVFVLLCGALGSMIYFSSSFVSYVGNRTFRLSWTWFYISRPFVGGALALLFFFIVGSGLVSGTSVGEIMKVGMISGLVGLFSDKAIKKLSDILDVILATKDDRKDKVEPEKPQALPNESVPAAVAAIITGFDPASIPPGIDAVVKVQGAHFDAGCKVLVGQTAVVPASVSDNHLTITVPSSEAKGPQVLISVTTSRGLASRNLKVQ